VVISSLLRQTEWVKTPHISALNTRILIKGINPLMPEWR